MFKLEKRFIIPNIIVSLTTFGPVLLKFPPALPEKFGNFLNDHIFIVDKFDHQTCQQKAGIFK